MYDFESLAKRLYDCGFSNSKVKECKLGEGLLPDLQYIEQQEHHPKSVFVEAIK
jgi:hypothetical protein